MQAVDKHLSKFLEENQEEFTTEWRKNVMISEEDIYSENVLKNGLAMYKLVICLLRGELNEGAIKTLAYKVAQERVQSGVNIGEFVYNVNLGRSEIFKHLDQSDISLIELQPVINKINQCFDQFIYHAVMQYTEIKNLDINEKQNFIDQTHKDRLTILGQMSSSFVHEFRNPLTAIMGFIKLLKSDNPELKYMDVIERELAQLNYRISQFLLVSKKGDVEFKRETFSVNELFDEIVDFLYPSMIDGEVEILSSVSPELFIEGSREELRQVFINIIINSIDALQQVEKNRKIMIDIHNNNDQLEIHISNNGPVIPAESKKTIFEPFVTTKKLGTGIGLFICKKIIEAHRGKILCHSDDSITTFSIYL
jgi:signal transduction histidine kinase